MADNRNIDIVQAEKDIEELKKQIVDVNDEKIKFDKNLEALQISYQKKMADLKSKHEKAVSAINKETEELNNKLKNLDEKTKTLSDTYKMRMDEVENEITEIKTNKFNVFNKELNKHKDKYEKTSYELNEQIETLLAKKNLYVERYNNEIIELDQKYKELKQKEEDNKQKLIENNAQTVSENEEALKTLEAEKNAIILDHEATIEKIKIDNQKILEDIKSKEQSIMKTLIEQRDLFKKQLTALSAQRDQRQIEVDEENTKLNKELEDTKAANQEEVEALKKTNDTLRELIEEKQSQLKQEAENQTVSFNKKKQEFDEYVKALGKDEEEFVEDLQVKLNKRDNKFKERFSSLVKGLDKTYENETKRFNQEIEALNYKLNVERQEYEKLRELNEARFAQKKSEYENIVSTLRNENQGLIEKAEKLFADYNERISKFGLDIIKLQEKNKIEIENLESELSKKTQEVSEELSSKADEIRKEIAHVNTSVKVFEDNIAKLNSDFTDYRLQIDKSKEEENNKQNSFINELNNRKVDLQNRIDTIEKEILILSTEKVDEMKSFYKAEKEKAINNHNERLALLKEQHAKELETRKQDFLNDCEQAKIDHENRIISLIDDTKKSREIIEGQIASIKVDYENSKVKLNDLTEKLQQDQLEQIEHYAVQRDNIHQQIEKAKETYLQEKEDYKIRIAAIEAEHEINLEKLRKEQEEKINELVRTMETIPSEELAKAKSKLEIVQKDETEQEIKQQMEKVQEEYEEFEKSHEIIRNEAQTIYDEVEKTLEFKKQEKQAALDVYNAQVDAKKQEILEHNLRLEKDITDIKKANIVEIENLSKQLDEQLLETKNAFNSKYEIVEREYTQEIDALKDELNHKRADYNLLINEANNKKANLENEYKIRCEEESAKTKNVQDELDRVLKSNDEQRAEWSRLLNLRNDQIVDENKLLVKRYEEALQEKRDQYQKCLDNIKVEVKAVKDKIAENEAIKQQKQNELDLFKMEKKIEMDNIKGQTDEIINSLTIKSQMIVQQAATLEEVHRQKVESYKKRVVELMAQLEELERVRPTIIRKAVEDGSEQLLKKTEEFKNKIQLLEKTNKEILEKLDLRRNQTVEQIKFEIKELVSGKTTTLKSHEEDLDRIVRTYEALLRDETSKQFDLNEQLVLEKARIAKEEAKYRLDNQKVEDDWKQTVSDLEKENQVKEQNLVDEMNPKLKDVTTDLLNCNEHNEKILQEIETLKEENDKFDKQIIEDKNNLVEEYINKLEDINNLFYKSQQEEKEKLKNVDVLSENILDLFKKH